MLKLDHISKSYTNGKKAVDDFSLDINKGEFVCIIGPSGCGKTTTLKMINRLIEPSAGTIYLYGENILKKNPIQLRRRIGYVIQQIGLFPHMTIGENITLVPRLLKWDAKKRKQRAAELLQLANMGTGYLDEYPSQLSGGQQQRIGVLRALAADPPLILMDEPFGALDPITRETIQDELKRLQRELDKTIVFVTHDMDEALKLSDRLVIMKDGHIVQADAPEKILRAPADDFVRRFIGEERLIQAGPSRVDQIMNVHPVTITKEKSLSEAIQLMRNKRVDTLLVVGKKQRFYGYVDVESIDVHRSEPVRVADLLQTDVYKVHENTLIRDVVRKILKQGVKYVPVVDDHDSLKGIVTRASLVDAVYDKIWGEKETLSETQ
ncbi:MAG: betaine/proline/choline family ABC transporter ATP-binding protein [Sporolactobacillus sp.]|nr:betaine/proline/choline family ABC transporter ATP-binding protein [Sporolactobacillus sp.]MCI1881488.1 betaine/proline/choline family ABC transporter ATP-binding protein [Sporolactobacillus sp.]